jgi:DNA-binding beta-propeller fold protein YncE
MLGALAVACGSIGDNRRPHVEPIVSATIPVGKPGKGIEAVAAGEEGIWVAGGGECPGSVWRIDPKTNRVVAAIAVDNPHDLAVGDGAVWVLGRVCAATPARPDGVSSGAALYRIDPASNKLAATIRLDPPPGVLAADASPFGVAFGEGGVWASVSYDPRTGEVIRIDPGTNEVVARISARGYAGELTAGGGAVWVLGHPEYTDETERGESLHRIDPRTNELVATPLRDERLLLGGYLHPQVIAATEHEVWVGSSEATYPYGALAIRIDARTNVVSREPLSMDQFFPVARTDGGLWFLGRGADLSRFDPRTLEIDESVRLGVGAADAAFDPGTRSFWVASVVVGRADQGSVVRVDLRY